MNICHKHNFARPPEETEKHFGIRIRVPADDPFRNLVGDSWETTHWFASEAERDRVLADKASRHRYSRVGDEPRLIFEAIQR